MRMAPKPRRATRKSFPIRNSPASLAVDPGCADDLLFDICPSLLRALWRRPRRSVRQRVRTQLELHQLGLSSLAALHVEGGACGDWGVDCFALPAGIRIVDAAVQAFRVVAHGVGDTQGEEP